MCRFTIYVVNCSKTSNDLLYLEPKVDGTVITIKANVVSFSNMTALLGAAIQQYGKVDILVNCAEINI